MIVPILSARRGWHTDELSKALAARGHEGVVLPYEASVLRVGAAPDMQNSGLSLDGVSALLPRIVPNGSLEQIIFRVDALHRLEEGGVRVMNSARAIERTVDKFYTSALLERAGIPTPETVVCERSEDAIQAFRRLGDVIVKPLFGSMGLGMARVSDEETAFRVFRAIDLVRGVFYLQRTIAHQGRDIRAFVVGERVIGAIERSAPGWRLNVSQGATPRAFRLPPEWTRLALLATRAVGAEYAGVDLLPGDDGQVYVLEVNGIPGWKGLQEATGLDVAGAIVEQLLEYTRVKEYTNTRIEG